jgi:hypothetical protein
MSPANAGVYHQHTAAGLLLRNARHIPRSSDNFRDVDWRCPDFSTAYPGAVNGTSVTV